MMNSTGYVEMGLRVALAWALAFGNAPMVFAKEFGVVEDLYVGRNATTPYGGIGRYENRLVQSEALGTSWTLTGLSATDGSSSPNGTTGADSLANTGAASGTGEQAVTITAAAAADYTFSVWLKAGTSSSASLNLTLNGTGPTNGASGTLTLTSSWQRVSVKATTAADTTSITAKLTNGSAVSGQTVLAWGAQLEKASAPGVYVRTTTAAVAAGQGAVTDGVPTLTSSGNTATATALAANGANCSASNAPLGVDAAGAAEGCYDVVAGAGDTMTGNLTFSDAQKLLGGTATTADLTLQTTSGVGAAGADMHFLVGNNGATEALTILNSGNVGIGTTAPAGLFHVSSNTAATGLSYFTQANASADGFDENFRKARGTAAAPTVITTADELGVINFTGYGGAAGYITGAAIKGISSGTIADSRVPGKLSFWTGTDAAPSVLTERMTILNSGNVGIGDLAPSVLLDVNGSIGIPYATSNTKDKGLYFGGDSNTSIFSDSGDGIVIEDYANVQIFIDSGNSSTTRYFSVVKDTSVSDGTGTVLFLVQENGNVGIGTTAPGTKLDINLAGTATLGTIQQNVANQALALSSAYGAGNLYGPGVTWYTTDNNATKPKAAIWTQTTNNGSFLLFGTSNAYTTGVTNTALTVAPTGNVGIGTTDPSSLLTVYKSGGTSGLQMAADTAQQAEIKFNKGGVDKWFIRSISNSNDIDFYSETLGDVAVTFKSGGNVGIGTTTVGALLDVDRPNATAVTAESVQLRSAATQQTLTDTTTIATWRQNQFLAPTFVGVNLGGVEAVTTAATVYIDAAPVAGADLAAITNPYSLWTDAGLVRMDRDGIGATATDGLLLFNSTDAAAGAQQISPALRLHGEGWKTGATAASMNVDWRAYVVPVEGAAAPTAYLAFDSSVNDAAFATKLSLTSAGKLDVAAGVQVGSGNVDLIDSTGKIAVLDSTTLANLSGAALTGVTASTATNLAADPADCATSTHFAVGVAASGAATCEAIADADVPDTLTASNYLPLAGGTMTGNIVVPNAGTIGQAAGPLLTFDDTANELEISGGNVGIGDTGPDSLLDILSATTGTDLIITNTNATDTDVTVGFALAEGTNNFTLGVDDSVAGDPFKISTTALGTGDFLTLDSRTTTSGVVATNFAATAPTIASGASTFFNIFSVTPGTVNFSGSTQITSTGTSANNALLFNQPTINRTDAATSLTIDQASNLFINGATIASHATVGQTETITASSALRIGAGASVAGTRGVVTNSYGLYVDAPTGATNNYAAVFASGNVGIGTTEPATKLDIIQATDTSNSGIRLANAGSLNAGRIWQAAGATGALRIDGNSAGGSAILLNGSGTGKVGIGTTNPAAPLDVVDSATSSHLIFGDTPTPVSGQHYVQLAYNSAANYAYLQSYTEGTAFRNLALASSGGNVGIGTTAPVTKLQINTTVDDDGLTVRVASGSIAGSPNVNFESSRGTHASPTAVLNGDELGHIMFKGYNAGAFQNAAYILGEADGAPGATNVPGRIRFFTATSAAEPTEQMRIDNAGNVGIGTTTVGNILTIVQTSATDPIADAWTTYSSRRWKTNITPIDDALAKVLKLQGVTFDWKANGKHDLGLIAEEVGEVVPEVVAYEVNGIDAKSVDYARLTALLIEAVKELQAENEALQARVDALEQR